MTYETHRQTRHNPDPGIADDSRELCEFSPEVDSCLGLYRGVLVGFHVSEMSQCKDLLGPGNW